MTFYVVLAVLLPWWLSRQRRQRAITPQRLIRMPLIFAGIGVLGLGNQDIPTDTAAAGYVAFSLTLSLLFGVWRGSLLPVWQTSAGKWMSQGNRLTVTLWVVLIAIKFVMATVASAAGWFPATGSGEVFLFFGISFAAQNVVVARRTILGGTGSARPPAPSRPAGQPASAPRP